MTAGNILQSDLLDIIFEGRNKSYGAYELRRQYEGRMRKAMTGTLVLIALLGTFLLLSNKQATVVNLSIIDTPTQLTPLELKKPQELEKPKQSQPVKQNLVTVNTSVPEIVPDKSLPDTKMPNIVQVDSSAVGDITKPGMATDINAVLTQDPITTGGPGNALTQVVPEKPAGPVSMGEMDELPEYPGGREALVRYMVNCLNTELDPGVKYMVRAMFIIDEEGRVSDAQILNSDDETLNNQVLKAIKRMKQWKPGLQKGHAVSVRFVMPVTFVGAEE
ncbi:MAG: TonB family protein [Chitinophagaceae bacterium]